MLLMMGAAMNVIDTPSFSWPKMFNRNMAESCWLWWK